MELILFIMAVKQERFYDFVEKVRKVADWMYNVNTNTN